MWTTAGYCCKDNSSISAYCWFCVTAKLLATKDDAAGEAVALAETGFDLVRSKIRNSLHKAELIRMAGSQSPSATESLNVCITEKVLVEPSTAV